MRWRRSGGLALALAVVVPAVVSAAAARSTSGPVVSGFTPAAGVVGSAVTLTGSGFTGATAVAFNGSAASFAVVDDGDIQTSVPFGATTGKVRVTTPAGTGTSATGFKVQPAVTALAPRWGVPGAAVTITGTAFTGATAVSFGGVPASAYTVDGYTQITATVPPGAKTGKIKVKTKGGSGTSATGFRVLVAGPAWPQYRHDAAHTGFDPDETALGPANVSGLQLAWSKKTGGSVVSSPAVAGGIVYFGSDKLYALDAATGTVLWRATTGGPIGSSPAVAGGIVYITSGGRLYAFDAVTGAARWTTSAGIFVDGSPAVAGGTVYAAGDHALVAFDAATGALRFSAPTAGASEEDSPAVANGTAYIGAATDSPPPVGSIHAFDASTGAFRWSAAALNHVAASPAVAGGLVYFDSFDGFVYAVDAVTGARRWSFGLTTRVWASPAVAGGFVFVDDFSGNLFEFEASFGGVGWSTPTGPAPIQSSPGIANGVIYLGTESGDLSAVDAATGAVLWSTTVDPGFMLESSPAIANDTVYVGSDDGFLYAYRLPAP